MRQSWFDLLARYRNEYPAFPPVKKLETTSINSDAVKNFIRECNADLVIVSGTSMIKKNILDIPLQKGMLNLHTGLSPYIKGAPNCTNWCIATDQLHYIGNTIMWIDAGIDSGDLLLTDTVPFTGDENLPEIQFKVMQAAHELYLGAIALVEKGIAPRVKQASISAGTTYYNRDWNFGQKLNLVRRLRQFKKSIQSDLYRKKLAEVKTITAL
ncbi:MAG: hypothetical protein EOP54_31855 [Sphingobacteriales bacterium]|nr:MAG: hypothetical protein EOP54_31855 [Sphingobacteriales bacterium]